MLKTGLLALLIFAFLSPALANTVKQVKGSRALLDLSNSDEFSAGDKVFALDEEGKRKGLITLEKIKGKAGLGNIIKGTAKPGWTLMKGPGGEKSKGKNENADSGKKSKSTSKFALGAMLGGAYDSMTVKVTTASGVFVEQLEMTGTGYSIKALADYDFTSFLGLRLMLGLEQFSATATPKNTASCDGGKCKTEIGYITLDAWGRYALIEGNTKVWLGAGVGSLSPTNKVSNALDPNSINSTVAIYLGGGADFTLDKDWYVPTQIDYAILPQSDQVQASIIAFRVGINRRF